MFYNEPKQTIDVAYTKQELLEKLQELRKPDNEIDRTPIYVLTRDVDEFHALARDRQITLVTSTGIGSFIKSLFAKETPIDEKLRRLHLPHQERLAYEKIIRNGGKVLVTGSDPFYEGEWTGHTLHNWITNRSNPSNLIRWDIKEERPVPFERDRQYVAVPNMAVAGEFGRAEDESADPDEIPLQDDQRYVRDPVTKELGIYQGPHRN